MHVIAGKAVAFGEALKPSFKEYIDHVVENAAAMGQGMTDGGLRLVSGGTDNHLCLVDLTPADVTGKDAEKLLESVGLTVNKNTIPNEQRSPFVASGIRVGSALQPRVVSRRKISTRLASASLQRCLTPATKPSCRC